MNGHIKHLFGICAVFVLLGAFVAMTSATTEYVEGGESIPAAADEPMPFYNNAISSHHMPVDRAIGEDSDDHANGCWNMTKFFKLIFQRSAQNAY